jgi:hypothetical protein
MLDHFSLQVDQFGLSDGSLRERITRRCDLLNLIHDDEFWIDAEKWNAQSLQLGGVMVRHLSGGGVYLQIKLVDFCFVLFWGLRDVSYHT